MIGAGDVALEVAAVERVGTVEDDHLHAAPGEPAQQHGQVVDEGVDASADVEGIDDQDLDAPQPLVVGQQLLAVQAAHLHPAAAPEERGREDHVVLFVDEKAVLQRPDGFQTLAGEALDHFICRHPCSVDVGAAGDQGDVAAADPLPKDSRQDIDAVTYHDRIPLPISSRIKTGQSQARSQRGCPVWP